MGQSHLEAKFALVWRALEGPELVSEHRFHPSRKWAFDFAYLPGRIAVEIEGGVWTGGRHNRAKGFIDDCTKYNEAALMGWRVIRLTDELIQPDTVERIIAACNGDDSPGPD